MTLYKHTPHARVAHHVEHGPPKVADVAQPHTGSAVTRFNARLAVHITERVGTMWCAYAFACLALVSLPSAIRSGSAVVLVSWISQTFLQLVLLSIIMVGQNVLAQASDKRAEATYQDADAVLAEALKIQEHLSEQDKVLEKLIATYGPISGRAPGSA